MTCMKSYLLPPLFSLMLLLFLPTVLQAEERKTIDRQEAVAHQADHSTPPNRPLGRTSNTSTMTRNITMEEASG